MEKKIATKRLRSFLYLDDAIVDDYLSQLEGAVIDGTYTQRDVSTGTKEGGAKIRLPLGEAGGQGGSSSTSETQQTMRQTPGARFARLYDLLEQAELIQPLSGFDMEVYQQLEPGEIVEVRGLARLPQWERVAMAFPDVSALLELMQIAGQDPLGDPAARIGYQGLAHLASKKQREDVLLIVTPLNATDFQVVARLEVSRLARRKEELEGEVTILGKLQRVLGPDDSIDAFKLAAGVTELTAAIPQNRASRRASNKRTAKSKALSSPWDEAIKYPAMQIQPIAVYQ